MKRQLIKVVTFLIIFALLFAINCYASPLGSIDITTNKTLVHPGEEITVTVDFGTDLGAYTLDFAYDNNLFEYVSTDGGIANDNGTRVRVVFYDSTGGTNTKSSMSIIFRAKTGIITSNPTEINVTAEGMANGDASVTYDDVVVPIVKNVTVEPQYVNYSLNLTYTGDVIVGEEKEMQLTTSSSLGKNYEHARLIAEVTTPNGGNVQLLGKDHQNLEHDLIQSGWGDPAGYKLGGVNVNQVLNYRGIFSKSGDYSITIKLIDRDSSDKVITQKVFTISVKDVPSVQPPQENQTQESTTNSNSTNTLNQNETKKEEIPTKLPKTGYNLYAVTILALILILLVSVFFYKRNASKKK